MKWIKLLFIACFMAFIAITGLQTITGKEEKSMTEGRTLALFPDLEYKKFTDETYLKSIENAFSDQLSGRENKIHDYYEFVVNILKADYAGSVSIGKDNRLYQEPQLIDDYEAYDKEAVQCARLVNEQAAEIVKNGAKFFFINYPRKDVVEKEFLPGYYPDSSVDYDRYIDVLKKELSSDVIFIDANELFKAYKGDEPLYYSTDHHVNAAGTQLVYQEIMKYAIQDFPETDVKSLEDYQLKNNIVDGSFNRKIGNVITGTEEKLNVKPKFDLQYKNETTKVPIFGKGDTYGSAYMGSDYAYTKITTEQKEAPSFVVCGSSYTNALEAFLVPSSRQMVSFDYRNNQKSKPLVEEVEKIAPDYVIYIPSASNLHFSYDVFKIHFGINNESVDE